MDDVADVDADAQCNLPLGRGVLELTCSTRRRFRMATQLQAPRPAPYSPQDRRMTIIGLPVENSSGDPAQDRLADALTRDVTDYIRRGWMSGVASGAMAGVHPANRIDLRLIEREHDVHFALTSSARREEGRLIVAATLSDVLTRQQIWAQRFDTEDQPEGVGMIVRRISSEAGQAAVDAEVARARREHPDDLDKRDLTLAADASALQQQTSRENVAARLALTNRAFPGPKRREGAQPLRP